MNVNKMNKYLQISAQDDRWQESVELREAVIQAKNEIDKTDIQIAKSRKTAQEIMRDYLEKHSANDSTQAREDAEFSKISAQESNIVETNKSTAGQPNVDAQQNKKAAAPNESETPQKNIVSKASAKPQELTQMGDKASEQTTSKTETETEELIDEIARQNALAQSGPEAVEAAMARLNQKIVIPMNNQGTKKKGILGRKSKKSADMPNYVNGNSISYTIMNRTPVIDCEEKGKAIQERVMSHIDKLSDDPIERMEQIYEANEKAMREEYEEYIAAGGDPAKFVPELIPYGIVYNSYMHNKQREEEKRLKEERSLKNKLKKKFNKDEKINAEVAKAQSSKVAERLNQDSQNGAEQNKNSATQMRNVNSLNNDGNQSKTSNDLFAKNNAFKNNFQVDTNAAASANKVYEKKSTEWDRIREYEESILMKNYELRELGMPVDETLQKELSRSRATKILSAMFIASAIVSNDPQWSAALAACGIIAYTGTKYAECKADIKYRKAIDAVRQAYINSCGDMTKEDVERILNTHKIELPDKYALACMTQEERNAVLEKAKNPNELSKRKLIKHIKRELTNYEVAQYEKMKKHHKARADELQSKSR